ncbi:BT_3987 domain-containing protein [Parabacteroides bouchesdurhonensis]|uniref:BT_3987 domain-containing protein n=1 Tax=Parabacteroides bouchesdurhonensis TaxID=1936995 RepID=UPI000E4B29EA|nr:DUF1735 domain-containing protein [Parabacteroides bouchesdurhonensis]RHJ95294.1 DUF1735 domain-containing protein [Bacteroides sp. AM07-16]
MKHIIKYIFCLGLLVNILTSCEDTRLDGMVDDKTYLLTSGFQELKIYNFGSVTYKFAIYKSGIGSSEAHLTFKADEETLAEYNQANNTDYKLLPSDMYSMPTNCTIAKEEERIYVEVNFDTQKIMDLQGKKQSSYIIPIKMISNNGIEIESGKNMIILAPIISQPCLVFETSGLNMKSVEVSAKGGNETFTTKVITNYENNEELTFSVEVDPSMMESYTGFAQMAPSESYSLESSDFTIPAGSNEKEISIELKKSVFQKSKMCGTFVIPLRIKSVSQYYLDDEESIQFYKFTILPDELSRTGWKVIDWNSCIDMDEEGKEYGRTPDKMLDGDETTFWAAKWFPPYVPMPYFFIFDMGAEHQISRLAIVKPGGSGNEWRGLEKAGYFEYSLDNTTWKKLSDWVMESNEPRTHFYDIPSVKARYIRLVITEAFEYGGGAGKGPQDGALMDIAEFKVWGY